VAACVLAVPPGALASNHLVKIREVYAGSAANVNSEYVELQAYAPGQNLLTGQVSFRFYDATGTQTFAFVPASNPPNAESQRRILVISQAAATEFNLPSGYTLSDGNYITDAGGAVCYETNSGAADCVSWGNFDNTTLTPLPSATGGNVDPPGIPDGSAISRSISRGCASMLEAGDDTNNPVDWSDVTPAPLNNASTTPEKPCPNTTITKKPGAKTTDRTPTFKFTSTINPATFECRLDSGAFKSCGSPLTTKKLSLGHHLFKVRAIAGGATDPTPAQVSFKVVKKPHH
jgi:hypothetical protein